MHIFDRLTNLLHSPKYKEATLLEIRIHPQSFQYLQFYLILVYQKYSWQIS